MKPKEIHRVQRSTGRARFYADENIDQTLVAWLRGRGYRVVSARECGYAGRDDDFHLQEAARRGCVLLSTDYDYLDNRLHPFDRLSHTAVVVLGTRPGRTTEYGYMLLALEAEIGRSGTANLFGLKIELRGPRIIFSARTRGRVRKDEISISKSLPARPLFQGS